MKTWTYDPDREYVKPKPEPRWARVEMRHCDDEGRHCAECGKPRGWPHDHRCRWDFANQGKGERAAERRAAFAAKAASLRERLGVS